MAGRDWAMLPSSLLCSVAERLMPVAYARVCTVCTDWASALLPEEWEEGQQQPYYLPRSLHCPWLLVPSEHDDEASGFKTFLSLPESLRPYRIAVPQLRDKYIVGSYAGWFAAADEDCSAFLINPFTRAQIPLPPVTTLVIPDLHRVEVVRDPSSGSPIEFLVHNLASLPTSYTPEEFRIMYFQKIIFSSSPSSGDFIVAFIFYHVGLLAFARAGATAWTILDRVPPKTYGYCDAVFLDRKLYAVTSTGQIEAFDFTQTEPPPKVVAGETTSFGGIEPRYLVFSSGDLLRVERIIPDADIPKTSCFTVEKIDLAGQGENNRTPVKDLGLQSLFLGKNQSLSISTQDLPRVRHNCIYFTDHDYLSFLNGGKKCTRDMGIFDIKEEICEALYPPDTWLTWPPPIWFAPVPK